MTDPSSSALIQGDSGQQVDRIRDIIFGAQMRDYEQRFQLLQRDLERQQQEIKSLTEQLADHGSHVDKKFQTLRRELGQADDDLRHEFRQTAQKLTDDKVDRGSLGELFIELGSYLKTGHPPTSLLQNLIDQVK